jgi:hypothetical protein
MCYVSRRKGAYRVLALKPEGKKQPVRPRRKCESNIKAILQNRKMA